MVSQWLNAAEVVDQGRVVMANLTKKLSCLETKRSFGGSKKSKRLTKKRLIFNVSLKTVHLTTSLQLGVVREPW